MITFKLDEVLELHKKLINRTGGSYGVRDIELLKSALENSFQTFGDTEFISKCIFPKNSFFF